MTELSDLTEPTLDVVQHHRERIWAALRRVGRPDSRFHWDFSSFIADFEGNDVATARVLDLPAWREASEVFITPDNSTELLRREALGAGKRLLVTTYGIRRGFLRVEPGTVPEAEISYAATLDGLDRYATPVTLAELTGGPPLRLLVTGGSAVSANGIRFGKGHGYFDLEWAMLSEIGLTGTDSEVVDIVHDEQFVDDVLVGEAHDVPVDWVVTPTRTIRVAGVDRAPGRVFWDLIPGTEHEHLPPILELQARREGVAS
ncbi:5-formyltetrahydrofolate cyclo-ligase [Spongisporangium articulatum]|uniref:5-formyltetrahydrofolate cyclo-ligase n=1 Tax=Spongisporangium articulatum TaxID=3362603 RepID=A0ABW8AKE0_9ACTN